MGNFKNKNLMNFKIHLGTKFLISFWNIYHVLNRFLFTDFFIHIYTFIFYYAQTLYIFCNEKSNFEFVCYVYKHIYSIK